MSAGLRTLLQKLLDAFWLIPALLVGCGVFGAFVLAAFEAAGRAPSGWLDGARWLYRGSADEARMLLGTLAGAALGVAGTVFSITIAALSLTAGQMGHHLLRNFTHDRGNQFTLGTLLATFAYAMTLLHDLRMSGGGGSDDARPSITLALLLALLCVAMLIYFVGHMAARINVETVVSLVGSDAAATLRRMTHAQPQPAAPEDDFWANAHAVRDARRGYLHRLDTDALADWAARRGSALRLLVRPGDYVFPGAVIALVLPPADQDGALAAIHDATALGRERISSEDLRWPLRELVEVAVRALSPGINSPNTALDVLDRLGASLCQLADRHLPTGVLTRAGRVALVLPDSGYAGLTDLMFNMIRHYGAASPVVLNRMLEVLTAVVGVETDRARTEALARHAGLVLADAERTVSNPGDLDGVRRRYRDFERMRTVGGAAFHGASA